jgi:hypothetical protein
MRTVDRAIALCLLLGLGGCASFSGAADPVLNDKTHAASVSRDYDEATVYRAFYADDAACLGTTVWPACRKGLDPKAYRNVVVNLYIGASDAAYTDFRTRLSYESKASTFGGNVTVLLMNALAVVSGDSARRALAAASAFVSGTQATVDRDLLLGRSWVALLTAMDAGRDAVKTDIFTRLQQPANAYSLEQALGDVRRLEGRATLTAAMERVAETVSADASQQKSRLEAAYVSELQGPLVDRKVAWLDEIEAMDDAGLTELARQFGATPRDGRTDQIATLRGWIDQNVETEAAFAQRQTAAAPILTRAKVRAKIATLSDAQIGLLVTNLALQPAAQTRAAHIAALDAWVAQSVQSAAGEATALEAIDLVDGD